MEVTKSRNQREGKYIPGWCYNPSFKHNKKTGHTVESKRAGEHYDVRLIHGFIDVDGSVIPGKTFYRTYREGAFE